MRPKSASLGPAAIVIECAAQEVPMRAPLDTPIYLNDRESLRLPDDAGLEVRCVLGYLWITEESDDEDRIIADGESFVLDRPGLSLK